MHAQPLHALGRIRAVRRQTRVRVDRRSSLTETRSEIARDRRRHTSGYVARVLLRAGACSTLATRSVNTFCARSRKPEQTRSVSNGDAPHMASSVGCDSLIWDPSTWRGFVAPVGRRYEAELFVFGLIRKKSTLLTVESGVQRLYELRTSPLWFCRRSYGAGPGPWGAERLHASHPKCHRDRLFACCTERYRPRRRPSCLAPLVV